MIPRKAQLTADARELGHTWVVFRSGSGLLLYSGNNAGRAKEWAARWADVEVYEVV